jgi:hypothetical protein
MTNVVRVIRVSAGRSGMLKSEHYEQWKEIETTFDPRSTIGGC